MLDLEPLEVKVFTLLVLFAWSELGQIPSRLLVECILAGQDECQ
jgi:hypothetical protein